MINEEFTCPKCGDLIFVRPFHMEMHLLNSDILRNNPLFRNENKGNLFNKYLRHIEWQCYKVQNHNGTVEQSVNDISAPLEMPNEFRTG